MTETAGAVQNGLVLRMSVPAAGEIGALGPELAVKLAEQLGVSGPQAERVGETIAELTRDLDPAGEADVAFEFHKDGTNLRVEARQGDNTRAATIPLGA